MNNVSATLNAHHVLASLVQEREAMHVGYVIRMSYDTVTVLTNDFWKRRAGNIPRNAFLIATTFNPDEFDKTEDADKVVVLLRARDEARIPQDGDTLKAIVEHYQRKTEVQRTNEQDDMEPITLARLQFSGLECHILGSFYTDAQGRLAMGTDVEDFYSMAQLRVYKPTPAALERIVNYIEPSRQDKAKKDAEAVLGKLPERIQIGSVRYTSALPHQVNQKTSDVPVFVQPMDFLGRRTAVFGMTRTGKSNTVKTTIAAVATVAKRAKVNVGQVVFDIKGEYANANGQDNDSSLAEALGSDVIRYGAHNKPGFEDLRDNFYDSLTSGLQMLQQAVRSAGDGLPADYQFLLELSLDKPDDTAEQKRWERNVAIYRCLLRKAGFPVGTAHGNVYFKLNDKVLEALHRARLCDDQGSCLTNCGTKAEDRLNHVNAMLAADFNGIFEDGTFTGARIDDAISLWSILRDIDRPGVKAGGVGLESSSGTKANPKAWLDQTSRTLLNIMQAKNTGGQGFRDPSFLHTHAGKHHSPTGLKNVPADVYKHLKNGKVVILDLSTGNDIMKKTKAEKIARYIFDRNMESFSSGDENDKPPIIMMYIEEAHNLLKEDDKIDTTWPRIAKEGAAFNLGMMYSTQEPSSINRNVLANTENFFVTHLSNDREIKSISEYYDFSDFSNVIKSATNVGFSRIKTLSASFVVPTQIRAFNPEMVKAEYGVYGTDNLTPPGA